MVKLSLRYLVVSILISNLLDIMIVNVVDRVHGGWKESGKPSPSTCLNFCWNAFCSVLQETISIHSVIYGPLWF